MRLLRWYYVVIGTGFFSVVVAADAVFPTQPVRWLFRGVGLAWLATCLACAHECKRED